MKRLIVRRYSFHSNNALFQVRYFGVRGSLATPLTGQGVKEKFLDLLAEVKPDELVNENARREFVDRNYPFRSGTIGGNTSCVQLSFPGAPMIICDAGTGLKVLGDRLMKNPPPEKEVNIFLSHTHWDHICGFPFFIPAYIPDYTINLYGVHDGLEERFRNQQNEKHFPVPFDVMGSTKKFFQMKEGEQSILGSVRVTSQIQDHPADSFAYRFDSNDSSVVYATDAAFNYVSKLPRGNNIFTNADVLIFDAMFSFEDYVNKLDWGHCSPSLGVDYCIQEKVRHLVLFHHDNNNNDQKLREMCELTRRYIDRVYPDSKLQVSLAVEGETLDKLEDGSFKLSADIGI